jgi:ABC-type glycerol-3-phosphate transport system substrate-binding protein
MGVHVDRRGFLLGAGATAAGAALAACGSPGGSSGTKASSSSGNGAAVSKIVFETNNQDPLAPKEVAAWNALKKSFTVELRTTDSATYADAFPQIATAKDAPNIAGYFIGGGHYVDLAKAGSLIDITEVWDKSGLSANIPAVIKNYYLNLTGDGKLYGAPGNTSRYGVFFYRKSTFEKAGVTPPTNHVWAGEAEFNTACDKLKAKGIAPITVGGKDGYPLSHIQDGLLSSTMAPEMIASPLKIDYNGDAWNQPLNKMVEWAKKGYFAKGYLGRTTDQATALFAQGKAGFNTGMNVWQPLMITAGIKLEDLDWCMLPPIGSLPTKVSIYAGGGIVIPTIAPGHAEAMEFGEYLLSPEVALQAAKDGAVIPARTDVPGLQDALGPIGGSMFDVANGPDKSQFGWDDLPPTDMITHDRQDIQAVLAGTTTVAKFSAKMETLKAGHA